MCLGFHGHCGEKSLLCQCRTFQSASLIAGEQWVEANTRANSWSIAFFLSTYSWLPLHIYFYLSSRDTWRAHLLQKTYSWVSAVYWSKEIPRGPKYVLKSRPESPVLMRVHMPGPQGTGAADVSHAPLGSPSPPFSLPFLPKYWHCWSYRGFTAAYWPEILWIMDSQHWFNFFLWS